LKQYKKQNRKSAQPEADNAPGHLSGVSRGLALFLGAFSLLNIVGELRYRGFDANSWWVDFRPIEPWTARSFLALVSVLLICYAFRPVMRKWRRAATLVSVGLLLAVTLRNALNFYLLLRRGAIQADFPVAFSLFVGAGIFIVLLAALSKRAPLSGKAAWHANLVSIVTIAVCLVAFPLAQMFCFGKTDYSRPADAIVVFGARVYADGRCSDALADRVRTGCRLYLHGYAHTLILSGGPGDGQVHETEAMKQMAIRLGVPQDAIILDRHGYNTQATVNSTCAMFEGLGVKRVLAVSHFYHLPRIKMTYQRQRWQVYTVPARETYVLTKMPVYILREIAALWLYYLRPLLP